LGLACQLHKLTVFDCCIACQYLTRRVLNLGLDR
jgi:hypothetical protein